MIRDHRERDDINPGIKVKVVLKKDQRSGKLTLGVVKKLLTSSKYHPRGIKVMLEDGQVGRVQEFV
ncbi:MAG: YwbE family protein [Arcobacter sp.]|nr:YwbE family protein [Arcobacter sp.]